MAVSKKSKSKPKISPTSKSKNSRAKSKNHSNPHPKAKSKSKVMAKKSTKKTAPKKQSAKKEKIKPLDEDSHKSIYILGKAILEIIEILGIELDVTSKRVVKILEEKERVSENELAEQLGVKINTVRKALYALDSIGFAYYIKEKDEEKKWWYIYYWTLNLKRVKEEYLKYKRKELLDKEDDLLSEQEYSFRCKSCKSKCKYEDALNSNFKCPECGCTLYEIRSTRDINKLREGILEIRKEIGLDNAELANPQCLSAEMSSANVNYHKTPPALASGSSHRE